MLAIVNLLRMFPPAIYLYSDEYYITKYWKGFCAKRKNLHHVKVHYLLYVNPRNENKCKGLKSTIKSPPEERDEKRSRDSRELSRKINRSMEAFLVQTRIETHDTVKLNAYSPFLHQ
ncbi:hypothetical protein HAX54_039244 [Datura stramonium]|uniref:Uncharacterized protein n=1 Tax=Datura stramonium TaxID=4076 RepID=A0ABS8VNT4_DATST|nr:hypothetical protein [Datura stramonium]